MTPETARALLADECRKRNVAFLIDRETGELDTLGQAAVAAVLAAGRAEREAAIKIATDLAEIIAAKPKFDQPTYTSVDAWKMVEDACRDIADAIAPGDHAPAAGEMG